MRRYGVMVGVSVVAVLAAACPPGNDGGAGEPGAQEATTTAEAGPVFVEVDGPAIGLFTAESVDEAGAVSGATRRFTPASPQITAIAFAGASTGEVVFEWFQVEAAAGGDEEEPKRTALFEHRVPVLPFQQAFSISTNPGTLAEGTYLVVARLGEASHSSEFSVKADETATPRGSPAAAPSAPPQAGESGVTADPPPAGLEEAQPRARVFLYGTWVVSGSSSGTVTEGPLITVGFETGWYALPPGGLGAYVVAAAERAFVAEGTIAMSGAPLRQRVQHPAGAQNIQRSFRVDPCRLSGGSDLPAAGLTLTNTLVSGGPGTATVSPATAKLGPDETDPAITTFDSSPAPASKVAAGQKISVEVIARDQKRPGATWQTGIKLLQLMANGESVDSKDGPRLPPKCDDSKRVVDWRSDKYEVPENPPAVIKLCILAEDHAGNVGEKCNEYYAGEVWKGEWDEGSGFKIGSFCPQFVPIRGTISFAVADDGSVSGRFEWANDPYTCGGPAPSVHSEGEVTGKRTADGFLLDIFGAGYPLRLTRQGNEASGSVEAGGNTIHAFTVRCVSCESGPVG